MNPSNGRICRLEGRQRGLFGRGLERLSPLADRSGSICWKRYALFPAFDPPPDAVI